MKSKKQKKGNVNDAKKEEKENSPKADSEQKVAKEPPKDYTMLSCEATILILSFAIFC